MQLLYYIQFLYSSQFRDPPPPSHLPLPGAAPPFIQLSSLYLSNQQISPLLHNLLFSHFNETHRQVQQKELSLFHKFWFSGPYIFATQCRRPKIFQTMKYVRSNNLSFKYQRVTPSGCKDIGISKFKLKLNSFHFKLKSNMIPIIIYTYRRIEEVKF